MGNAQIGHIEDFQSPANGAVSLTPDILKILEETREGAMEEIEAAKAIKKDMIKIEPKESLKPNNALRKKLFEFLIELNSQHLLNTINNTGDYSSVTDGDGNTLLMLLVKYAKFDLAKELMELNVDTRIANHKGRTAISLVQNFHSEEGIEMIKSIIEHGGDANNPTQNNDEDPLMVAYTYDGNLDMIKFLLEHGSNINLPNSHGSTPLIVSAKSHKTTSILHWLLNNGANPNIKDGKGKDAFDYAVGWIGSTHEGRVMGEMILKNPDFKKTIKSRIKAFICYKLL